MEEEERMGERRDRLSGYNLKTTDGY